MTRIGAGGVIIRCVSHTERFKRDYQKLDPGIQKRVDDKIRQLQADPRPRGLRFEKLKGYSEPSIYTVHVTGSYKFSLHIEGDLAVLRRVAAHDDIHRRP